MNRARIIVLPAIAVIAAVGVLYWSRIPPAPAVVSEGAAVSPAAPANQRIPAGKGDTSDSGKFVPAGAAAGAPASRDEAEQRLREALHVEELSPGKFRIGRVTFDKSARTVSVPAKVNMRGGVLEYVLTTEAGKAHEALLTTTASPKDLHLACLLLGMKGGPVTGKAGSEMTLTPSGSVRITVSWETNGPPVVLPLAALLRLAAGGPESESTPMADGPWYYNGSRFYGAGGFAAEAEGSFISLIRDDAALLNYPGPSRDNDNTHVPNPAALPPAGAPVTVTLRLP